MSSALAQAHIRAEAQLRRSVVTALTRIWGELPAYNRENVDEWLSRALPAVAAGQRRSIAVTEAYLARALGRQPLGLDREQLMGAAVRAGTAPEDVYQRPFVTLWSSLGEGTPYEDAVAGGLARATSSAAMDVQLSMRATADAVDAVDEGFYGYTRVADPGACEFCLEVDGAYVKASDGFVMALHNNCGCGLEPNTAPHRGAVRLPDGSQVRAHQYGPLTDKVAVEEHGELGPLLVHPDQHFTQL